MAALSSSRVAAAGALFVAHRDRRRWRGSRCFDVATDRRSARPLRVARRSANSHASRLSRCASSRETTTSRSTRRRRSPARQAALRTFLASKKIATPRCRRRRPAAMPSDDAARAASVLRYAQQHYADRTSGPGADDDLTEAALRGIMNSRERSVHRLPLAARDPGPQRIAVAAATSAESASTFTSSRTAGSSCSRSKRCRPPPRRHEARRGRRLGRRQAGTRRELDRVEHMIRGEAGTTVHLSDASRITRRGARSHRTRSSARSSTCRRSAPRWKTASTTSGSPTSATTSADEVRKALLDGQAQGRATATSSTCATTAAACSTRRSQISSLFVPQGTIVSTIRRDGQRTTEEALGTAIGGLQPLVDSGQQVHGQRFGDHRRRAAGLPARRR